MWMVFNSAGNYFLNEPTVSAVTMLNGKLAVTGTASNHTALAIGDFVSEFCQIIRSNYDGDATGLVNRNQSFWSSNRGNTRIVNNVVNDVAMTVLPNAPIDAATGLPVPTIAVATDGGTSVIKDDGTVVDITGANLYHKSMSVNFTPDKQLVYSLDYSGNSLPYSRYIRVDNIPSSDFSATSSAGQLGNSLELYSVITSEGQLNWLGADNSSENLVIANNIGTENGLTFLDRNQSAPANGMVAYTASDYATGYQVGDIKLATLSDTDDTNVTGSNLIVNGDFSSNSDWDLVSGFYSIGSGVLTSQSSSSGVLRPSVNVVPVVGKTYVLTFDITAHSAGTIYVNFGHIWVASGYHAAGVGSKSFTFTPTSTAENFSFYTAAFGGSIDNVVLREAEPDRSVNGNGLQVFGTVTKTPVATGADLVGYRGNGYLFQPQAGGLNLTNDLSITWWQKHNGGGIYEGWQIAENSTSGANAYDQVALSIMHQVSSSEYLIRGNGLSGFNTGSNTTTTGSWQCVCFTKVGTTYSVYLNGVLTVSATESNITTPSNPYSLQLLRWQYGATVYSTGNSDFALFRTSATAPSPEQIAKIYNDEKFLFQDGAQATLYGSSDAVTALAHDDSTDLLHVGTSAGRSVFQGLRRVSNTTDAVGAAISASNGLVAED
jgi:hypothetical protein